jgi:hypothetical protein
LDQINKITEIKKLMKTIISKDPVVICDHKIITKDNKNNFISRYIFLNSEIHEKSFSVVN